MGNPTSTQTDILSYLNGNLSGETQAAGVTVAYDYYGVGEHGSGASPGALKAVRLVQNGATISTTTYQYDANSGRLQNIVANGQPFGVGYLSGTNLVNAISNATVSTSFGYDPATGRLATIATSSGGTGLYSAAYMYNQNDQRATDTVSQTNPDGSVTSSNLTYGYDSLDELTSVTGTSAYSYAYDGVGNRTGTSFGTANNLNQFSNISYNTRGDEKDDGTNNYLWDAAGRMTLATADNNSVKVANQFDGQGRRVEKDVYAWNASLNNGAGGWALSYTRKYAFDGTRLIAELDGNNQMVTGCTWVAGTLIAVTDYTVTVPKVYTVISDASGNTVALVDPVNGAVAATYTYDPYGKLLTATGPAAGVCNVLFGKGYTDRETGLVLLGARFYSPAQGRFISRDPIAEQGGTNLYVYAGDDPINLDDPSGLDPADANIAADYEALADQQKLIWLQETYGKEWTFSRTAFGFLGTQNGNARQMTFDPDLNQMGYFSPRRQWRIEGLADGSIVKIHSDPAGGEISREVMVESAEVQRLRASPIWGPYMAQAADDAARVEHVAILAKQVGDVLDTAVRIGSGPAGIVLIDAPEAITGNSMTKPGEKVSGMDRLMEGTAVGGMVLSKAERVAILIKNVRKGGRFEDDVIEAIPGAVKNGKMLRAVIEHRGQTYLARTLPDVMIARAGKGGGVMIEIKNRVKDPVYLGSQLKTQLAWAKQAGLRYRMIVSPKTRLTDEAYNAITEFGGTVETFNRATGNFNAYVP